MWWNDEYSNTVKVNILKHSSLCRFYLQLKTKHPKIKISEIFQLHDKIEILEFSSPNSKRCHLK